MYTPHMSTRMHGTHIYVHMICISIICTTCTHVYITHARTHAHTNTVHTCMHARRACTHVGMHARTYARTHARTHARTRTNARMHTCTHARTHAARGARKDTTQEHIARVYQGTTQSHTLSMWHKSQQVGKPGNCPYMFGKHTCTIKAEYCVRVAPARVKPVRQIGLVCILPCHSFHDNEACHLTLLYVTQLASGLRANHHNNRTQREYRLPDYGQT